MNAHAHITSNSASTPLSFTPLRSGLLQRKCACGGAPGVAGACADCDKEKLSLQRKTRNSELANPNSTVAPPIVQEVLSSPGQPLDQATRAFLEPRFGHNFANVRVHTDAQAAASARALDSLAYTTKNHIVFEAGRYSPGTPKGKKLLEHEAAHIVHQAHSNTYLPGIAPPESVAEQRAASVPDSTLAGSSSGQFKRPINFLDWGPAWEIHPQKAEQQDPKIKKLGTTAHVSAAGDVEVRTGEAIELSTGASLPNVIALEYSGPLTSSSKWLQFIWATMIAVKPEGAMIINNTIPMSGGSLALTQNSGSPIWGVDSASKSDPFYEAGFSNIRDKSSTTIFDAPGGPSGIDLATLALKAVPGATYARYTSHFDTYLIQNDAATYHVSYKASTKYSMHNGAVVDEAIGYTVEDSGPVTALPENLKTILHTNYSAYKHVK